MRWEGSGCSSDDLKPRELGSTEGREGAGWDTHPVSRLMFQSWEELVSSVHGKDALSSDRENH